MKKSKKRLAIEKKYNPLIGCPTYIELKNGYLIIDSKAKVRSLNKTSGVGMFVGLDSSEEWPLVVSYNNGFATALYQPKYTKVI